jgi:hypothetical protein
MLLMAGRGAVDPGGMVFLLAAVAIGVIAGSVLGRLLVAGPRTAPPVVAVPEEPTRLSMHKLEELLAPYEHAAA